MLGTAAVTYTATDRSTSVAGRPGAGDRHGRARRAAARRRGRRGTGARRRATGAVLGRPRHRAARPRTGPPGFAVPLRPRRAPTAGPLAALLARNAATVPAYGPDLNLAGALELTATSVGSADGPEPAPHPVERDRT